MGIDIPSADGRPIRPSGREDEAVLKAALRELLRAADLAARLGLSAVQLDWLGDRGLTPTDVRRLIFEGFVDRRHRRCLISEQRSPVRPT